MVIALSTGCGGGGGAQSTAINTSAGTGQISYKVVFKGRSSLERQVSQTSSETVTVEVSISGYYEDDGTVFDPVTASKDITITSATGYGTISVMEVPIGKNHLLIATAKWSDGFTESVKAIIPQVQENVSTSVTADQRSTAIAEAVVRYGELNSKKLNEVTANEMKDLEDAVDYYYAQNNTYVGLTEESVTAYLTPSTISVTPATASLYEGSTQQFAGAIKNSQGVTLTTGGAIPASGTWTVTGNIGTVSTTGLFTATAAGTGSVVYTYGSITGTAAVTVLSSALTITITPSTASVISGATQQFSVAITNAQSDAITAAGTWSVSGGVGTITTAGLFTASTAGTGAVVYTQGNYTGSATVVVTSATAAAACSSGALTNVSSAKSLLFQPTVSATDFNSAKSYVDAALADSPSCPDALVLSAIGDMATEGERVSTTVAANPETIFPLDNGYTLTGTVGRVISPVMRSLPRVGAQTTTGLDEYSNASEFQTEIITTTMDVLEGALAKLEAAQAVIATDATWSFTIPKDPANLTLGNDTLDSYDVDILTGSLKLLIGYVYYLIAYNLDVPSGYETVDPCAEFQEGSYQMVNGMMEYVPGATDTTYMGLSAFNECVEADANNDKILTPTEYLLPSPYGTLNTNGATYLANFKSYVSGALTLLDSAVTGILAETTSTLGGQTVATTLIDDINYYKHYLSELSASFGGTATVITYPAKAECWNSMTFDGGATYYYAPTDVIDDPTYNSAEAANCEALFEIEPERNLNVNLGALGNVADLRDILPTYDMVTYSDMYTTYTDMYFAESFEGNTMGGLFPNGFDSTQFGWKSAFIMIYVADIIDSTTSTSLSVLPETGITLTDGTNTVTAQYAYGDPNSQYMIHFGPTTSMPTSADFLSFNDFVGQYYTLTIPGYDPVSIKLYEEHSQIQSITVTPTVLP